MHVTIAIATYNRAEELRSTLDGLVGLAESPGDSFDILVVDNRSTDETPRVVAESLERFSGRLRSVREEKLGLSNARNRAIAESQGDVVAFLDDDVDVDPWWHAALCDSFRAHDAAAVGGRTRLVYPVERPRWIGPRQEGLLSKVEHGDDPKRVGPGELFGVNLSIKREWLDRVGGFRTDLGRLGTRLFGGEEADILERIESAGGTLWYEPKATVGHRVALERVTRKWFLRRAFWGAYAESAAAAPELSTPIWFARYAYYAVKHCGRFVLKSLRHGPGSAESFDPARAVATNLGRCRGILARLRAKAS